MKLKYFLDHPQINRKKSFGNGNKPGSIADRINFGGKSRPVTKPAPKTKQATASTGEKKKGNIFTNFMSFGKNKDK